MMKSVDLTSTVTWPKHSPDVLGWDGLQLKGKRWSSSYRSPSGLFENYFRWPPHEADWEVKSVWSSDPSKVRLFWRIWNIIHAMIYFIVFCLLLTGCVNSQWWYLQCHNVKKMWTWRKGVKYNCGQKILAARAYMEHHNQVATTKTSGSSLYQKLKVKLKHTSKGGGQGLS